jgi:hypothetical protein
MKRMLILIGLVAAALLALALISAALAAPNRGPSLQAAQESEPNDSLAEADTVDAPGSIRGSAWNSVTDTDYFVMNTEQGRDYEAKLTIDSPKELKLEMILYDGNGDTLDSSPSSSSETSLSTWTAYTTTYYIQVAAIVLTETYQTASYRLQINRIAVEPTLTPSPTPKPTNTPTPISASDSYEPNNSFEQAKTLPVQVPITLLDLTFHVPDDEDWFRFWAKDNKWYQVTTSDLSLVDTYLKIYDDERNQKTKNDDSGDGFASAVQWEAKYDGYYYIFVENKAKSSTGSYDLTLVESDGPAPTASPTPGPGADPKVDDCEDNLDFERACILSLGEAQTFNLVPPWGEGPDNDFYKVWIKSGLHFRCATSNLSPGVDPNMIVFTGPSWDQAIGGNDDIEKGNYNSAFNYYATYDGWLYVLIGTGDRTPPDIYDSDYTLLCEKSTEPFSVTRAPSPTPTPEATSRATATPTPTTAGSPVATPTPETQGLTVRPLTTPTPVVPTTPAPRFVPVRLLVYYDGNGDGLPGAGEGIAGISAQAYEVASNELLAQDFTDEQGNLEFTVSAQGPVRISIPFLGFSHLVSGAEASIQVRVPPHSLPGGTP